MTIKNIHPSGFSLLEILISIAILSSVLVMLILSSSRLIVRQWSSGQTNAASVYLQEQMEYVYGISRSTQWAQLQPDPNPYYLKPQTSGWEISHTPISDAKFQTAVMVYHVYRNPNDQHSINPDCTSASGDCLLDPLMRKITVSVDWPENPTDPITSTSYVGGFSYTPPNTLSPTPTRPPYFTPIPSPSVTSENPYNPLLLAQVLGISANLPDIQFLGFAQNHTIPPGLYYVKSQYDEIPNSMRLVDGPWRAAQGWKGFALYEANRTESFYFSNELYRCHSSCIPMNFVSNNQDDSYDEHSIGNIQSLNISQINFVMIDMAGDRTKPAYFLIKETNQILHTVTDTPTAYVVEGSFKIPAGATGRLVIHNYNSAGTFYEILTGSPEPPPTPTPTIPAPSPTPLPTIPVATPTPLPSGFPTPLPTSTPGLTSTPIPTSTPLPTSTPRPTSTPWPTATPAPCNPITGDC